MNSALLDGSRLHTGAPRWLDTDGSSEHEELLAREELRRREDNALRVYRRRIASLQLERELLKEQLAGQNEEFARTLDETAREARTAGIEEGRAQMRRELLEQFGLLGTLETELRARGAHQQREADREILRFARWLAGQVIRRVPDLDGQDLLQRIRTLLDWWVGEASYRFRLHPEDRRLLLEDGGLGRLAQETGSRIEWLASPEVPRGGCRLELVRGLVEAVPEAMLDELLAVLERELSHTDPAADPDLQHGEERA